MRGCCPCVPAASSGTLQACQRAAFAQPPPVFPGHWQQASPPPPTEVTRWPHAFSSTPMLEAVTPFPRPLTTPPVTRTYFMAAAASPPSRATCRELSVMREGRGTCMPPTCALCMLPPSFKRGGARPASLRTLDTHSIDTWLMDIVGEGAQPARALPACARARCPALAPLFSVTTPASAPVPVDRRRQDIAQAELVPWDARPPSHVPPAALAPARPPQPPAVGSGVGATCHAAAPGCAVASQRHDLQCDVDQRGAAVPASQAFAFFFHIHLALSSRGCTGMVEQ